MARKVKTTGHPDHSSQKKRLNRIIGQLNGVGRMIDDRRYCPDIMIQTRAVVAAIKSLEDEILEGHLRHCVHAAMKARNADDSAAKIDELMELFRKRR